MAVGSLTPAPKRKAEIHFPSAIPVGKNTSPQATELLIQCAATECQSRGATVRAMVRIINEVPLAQEFLHFFQR